MSEVPSRLEVQYDNGSNWTAFTTSGNSLLLELEIDDTLYQPQVAKFKIADLKDNGPFAASSTNSVLKEFMNIRILDPVRYIVYFSGKIYRIGKKYQHPYGEVLEVVCYDALYNLGNEFLDTDADSIAATKAHTLISTWIANHISTGLLSTTNDGGDVDRFETSAYNRANTSKVVKAGRSQISVLSAILQEAIQDQLLTTKDRGYVYYVDPNFTSTATSHRPAGFFNYFARNRRPGNEYLGAAASPNANGLTIEKPSGSAISETGTKHLMMSDLDISSSSRELITDVIAHYFHEDSGKRVSKRFSIIHFTAHSGMNTNQYDGIGFDADVGTGGSDISNLVDSGGNVIGRIQYVSSLTAFPAYMILSDRTSHALVAGETLSADSHGSGASITLSSVATLGSQFVYEPKAVWGVTKTVKANFGKESTADEIRTKIAAMFEGRQNVPARMSFTTSQLPYCWEESRATSSTTGSTLHDSALTFMTKGIRTGDTFLKLSGTGGTIAAYGYVSGLSDAGVITCPLNTGTWGVNDYYRWQVRVRAGHQLQVICAQKGVSSEGNIITRIRIQQNMGSQTITSYETQGTAARSVPTNLAESTTSDSTHAASDGVGASTPVPIGDVTGKLTCIFSAGAKSSPDGTRHNTVTWTAGTLKLNKTLNIDGNETDEYSIAQNDTTTAFSGALTADGTQYVLYFQPDVSTTELKVTTSAAWESIDRIKIKIATITTATDTGAAGAGVEAECMWDSASTGIIIEGPASTAEGYAMKLGGDYFAADGILAKHMLNIGSDATSGVRFKFNTPTSGGANTWFRGFTGDSNSDTTGKWFEFDVANKALNFFDGGRGTSDTAERTGHIHTKLDESGLTFYDTTAATASDGTTAAQYTGTALTFYNTNGKHADNKTVEIQGNTSANSNGLYIYGQNTAGGGFGGSDDSVITFVSGGAEEGYIGIYQDGSGDEEFSFYGGTTETAIRLRSTNANIFLTTATSGNVVTNAPVMSDARFELTGIISDGVMPDNWYGMARYAVDGGGTTTSNEGVLAFLCGQADASTAFATYNSSPVAEAAFWTMLNEGDGASGSRLIFEPNVDYYTSAGSDNLAYIGYHNPLAGVLSYYLSGGTGTNAAPSHTFFGDTDTGMYNFTTNIIGFAANGVAQIGIYDGGIYPLKGTNGNDTLNGTTTYRWEKGWFIDLHSTNAPSDDSDRRLKDNIQPNTLGLDFVNDLNPVSYKWKDEGVDTSTHYGIIAQDIIETLKDYGIDSLDDFGGIVLDTEKDRYGARYTEFIPILIKAVQELSAEIKELKEKN